MFETVFLLLKKPVVQITLQDVRRVYRRRHGLMPLVSLWNHPVQRMGSQLPFCQWFIDV